MTGAPRRQLAFAAAGVLVAAADTYVVVVAFPAIMTGVGIPIQEIQRATPVISGYLLGYVAVLPLLGRLADQIGKRPVFLACLAAFAAGSVVTATAHVLSLLVVGRAIQGLGGGGLVPVTLALVAERWPAERRGLPLGVVGAVQELGSVLGPLYGAAVVTVAGWRWIFWLNLPLAAVVGVGYLLSGGAAGAEGSRPPKREGRPDVVGVALAALAAVAFVLALDAPGSLASGVTTGRLYAPLAAGPTWSVLTTPMALAAWTLAAATVAWEVTAPLGVRPLVPLRRVPAVLAAADLPGAALFAGVLACVVVVFSTTDPGTQVVASSVRVLGPVAAALVVLLVWRQARAGSALLDPEALRARPAWGAMAVNLTVGAGLMAALVDVPFFARATTDAGSQLAAAGVLLRFLVAVPIGAVAGGILCRRAHWGPAVAAAGMVASTFAFTAMSGWSPLALAQRLHIGGTTLPFGASDIDLVVCGLGFGLAIAPVNSAVLAAVPARAHGLASSLVVVARTVGMLVGISALTAVALHRFYRSAPSPLGLCRPGQLVCAAFERAETAAILTELHTVFVGAAVCTGAAAALSLLLLPLRKGNSATAAPALAADGRRPEPGCQEG